MLALVQPNECGSDCDIAFVQPYFDMLCDVDRQGELEAAFNNAPSVAPSFVPTESPSNAPFAIPTFVPTILPTISMTALPTVAPFLGSGVDESQRRLDNNRWSMAIENALCDWEYIGQMASVEKDMISQKECLQLCDQDPKCEGWAMWNDVSFSCIVMQTPCRRWSSPGAHPGWSVWMDQSRVKGWVTEGALGFFSSIDVRAATLFGDWRGHPGLTVDFVQPGCPVALIRDISEDCGGQCPREFGPNVTAVTDVEYFHCLCARCDLAFLLRLCATSPACAVLHECSEATATYASLSINYTCDDFAVTQTPCPRHWLGNGFCDEGCNAVQYDYDEGDCKQCAPGCQQHYIGDHFCDEQCNTRLCNFDGGDCGSGAAQCSPGCFDSYLGDSFCDGSCNTEECNFDDGDCLARCAEGCDTAFLGDSFCDRTCNVFECNYDLGDCNECSDGCPFSWLADGVCDPPCQTIACSFDFGDCPGVDVHGSFIPPPTEGSVADAQCSSIYNKLARLTLRIGNMQLQENYLANAIAEVERSLAQLEIERSELEAQYLRLDEEKSDLHAEHLLLQIEKSELEQTSWALGNQTLALVGQRSTLENERNNLQSERDALEEETTSLAMDKATLEEEQRLLEIAKGEVEDQRDNYLLLWLAKAALLLLILNMLLGMGCIFLKSRRRQKSAYVNFKKEHHNLLKEDPGYEAENEPKGVDRKSRGLFWRKKVACALDIPDDKYIVPGVITDDNEEGKANEEPVSGDGLALFDVNAPNPRSDVKAKGEACEGGKEFNPKFEFEDMLVFLNDEDTVEGQGESQAKLDDVIAKLALEEAIVREIDAIEQAVSDESKTKADKLNAAIMEGDVAAQCAIFEGVQLDLAELRGAHSNEMGELQKQLANNALANDELLAMRLKRRRQMREKALRESGANEEQVKMVTKDFDILEKATLEHQQATHNAMRDKVNAVAAAPAECMTDTSEALTLSRKLLQKQFKTDESVLEALKSNERRCAKIDLDYLDI
jgi:hypothetical protein